MTKIEFAEFTKFQRLNYVQIAPSGSLIALAGKNKQGKSSILDGLEAAICGHNGRVITRPINEGADKAGINVETDDGLIISRTYTPSGSKLVIKAADGAKYGQAKLDSIVGSLGIDASQFASLNDKDQLQTLLGLVKLPFNPAQLEAERAGIFETRTDVNRDLKQLTAQINACDLPADGPTDEVGVTDLLAQYRAGQAKNEADDKTGERFRFWADQVEALKAKLAEAQSTLLQVEREVDGMTAPVDLEAIQAKIANVEQANAQAREWKAYNALLERKTRVVEYAFDLTEQIEAIDKRKADGLAAAKFPVEGLGFDADGVLYNGRPFNRASSAEKVLVSAAMMIALNPELRVLIVRNGNDLDSESLTALEAMADEADFQIFIEIVNESGDFGITIEDGEVAP
jgi:hypothetical protein